MRRIVSVWLPHWPIDRMRRADKRAGRSDGPPADDRRPFALTLAGPRGLTLSALNRGAAQEGLARGMTLADARTRLSGLMIRPAEPEADAEALKRLALWALRFSPLVATDGEDGLLIETGGVAHLFGGEARLLEAIETGLASFGITARAAMAPTIGGAFALARFSPARAVEGRIAQPTELRQKLAALPPAALRLDEATVLTLKRFGLKTIGHLYGLPRASLARRFNSLDAGERVLLRLDQALGAQDEPLSPFEPPPLFRTRLSCPEPIATSAAIEMALGHLLQALMKDLEEAGTGARELSLALYRTDGEVPRLAVRTSAPSRSPAHFLHLFKEHLGKIDPGFGIDLLILAASRTEAPAPAQASLTKDSSVGGGEDALTRLIDRLAGRLGEDAITRTHAFESQIPERAEILTPALHGAPKSPLTLSSSKGESTKPARPFRLFDAPEPIAVMAEVPDGPPLRFTWRRLKHEVVRAAGPERIAPEWWRSDSCAEPMRDYYEIEDRQGRRFWVFRSGLYEETGEHGPPKWFVHGLA